MIITKKKKSEKPYSAEPETKKKPRGVPRTSPCLCGKEYTERLDFCTGQKEKEKTSKNQ